MPIGPDYNERTGENEALFREVNERLKERKRDDLAWQAPSEWICECAEQTCTERIVMSPLEYEQLAGEWRRPTMPACSPLTHHAASKGLEAMVSAGTACVGDQEVDEDSDHTLASLDLSLGGVCVHAKSGFLASLAALANPAPQPAAQGDPFRTASSHRSVPGARPMSVMIRGS